MKYFIVFHYDDAGICQNKDRNGIAPRFYAYSDTNAIRRYIKKYGCGEIEVFGVRELGKENISIYLKEKEGLYFCGEMPQIEAVVNKNKTRLRFV